MLNPFKTRTYRGCNITRMSHNPWGGRWEAYAGYHFIRADTLVGIRSLIQKALKEQDDGQ